jgi:hypothetical protein
VHCKLLDPEAEYAGALTEHEQAEIAVTERAKWAIHHYDGINPPLNAVGR